MNSVKTESPIYATFVLFVGMLLVVLAAYLFKMSENEMSGYAANTFIATPNMPVPLKQSPFVAHRLEVEQTQSLQGS